MARRRALAVLALILVVLALAGAVALTFTTFPRGILAFAAVLLALPTAWHGLLRRGVVRVLGVGAAVALTLAAVVLLLGRAPLLLPGTLVALWAALAAARVAFRVHVRLPPAPAPRRPVLFYNPHSGGGKAERFHVAGEARARGIEPVALNAGDDLERLARDAAARGADALAMAGGDGSQAAVAKVAADVGLPYACVPAGTRNHFALDLGVDRDDVVGALDALVDGGERVVDLADVNGRVFVNNVSLGLYAEAVQRDGYRDAKLRTLVDTLPDALGPASNGVDLRWRGPDGDAHRTGAAILVSNNPYRLGAGLGSGTRPRLDDGTLGVAAVTAGGHGDGPRPRLVSWAAPTLHVDATGPVPAGVDGEAVTLSPPLRFRVHRAALRCRIARTHPGASPSAFMPESAWQGARALAGIAAGHDPRPVPRAGAG